MLFFFTGWPINRLVFVFLYKITIRHNSEENNLPANDIY